MEPPAHAVPPPPHLDAHVPVPESCRYVTLRGKGNFTNVIMSRVLRWGMILGYPGGQDGITGVLTGGS